MDQRFVLLGAIVSGSFLFAVFAESSGNPLVAAISVSALTVLTLLFARSK